ncbi:MAG: bifunctional metallophosphatase/5'-nucleotidase [Desulfobulbaceae bacterium]|nr:bifunctional metallophosphatase/5'-nucleotidase [Desulfobulbaceae bacterium]
MLKKIPLYLMLFLLPVMLSSCAGRFFPQDSLEKTGAPFEFVILQMNDIYELAPVSGGKEGGLARVAALRKELLAQNKNTITVLAGDLFSPSALGTAKVDGERLAGRQIVAVMNSLGLDYITFGNHEFDLDEQHFLARLAESHFSWISSNVVDRNSHPFKGVAATKVLLLHDELGRSVRLGLFGLTAPLNRKEYVHYDDPVTTARQVVSKLRDQVDVLVALTHLPIEDDIALAASVPGIDVILGGHEHENMQLWRGPGFVPIFKADANARTVYIHRLFWDSGLASLTISSELRRVDDRIAPDRKVTEEVAHWQEKGFEAFRQQGFDPQRVIAELPEPLDGLESHVRTQQTTLTRLIAEAMLAAVPGAELSLYNSGSVRIDDVLPPGPLTEYDLIRILPFGGMLCETTIDGALLRQILAQGEANRGNGGFLQTAGVVQDREHGWLINGKPIDPGRSYSVAVNDFLLSGREQNFGFFSAGNPAVQARCQEQSDIRFAVKRYLIRAYAK